MLRLISLLACAAIVIPAQAAETPHSYVVTVKAVYAAEGTRTVAAQMAASYGGTMVNDSAGDDSFVLRLPAAQARVLKADPRVSSVRLIAATNAVPETVKWSSGVSYTYDGAGDISKIGDDAFTYDAVGRLTAATINAVKRKYSYDGFGNRTDCSENGANDCQVLAIDTTARLNRFKSSDASYDAAGNVQEIPLFGHRYSYDAFNMMTKDVSASTREFVYTADDERLATYTVGSSWRWTVRETSGKVLRELSSRDTASGWKWEKDYVYRDGLLLASRQPEENGTTTTYHYHLDHLGTPRRVTDQSDQPVGNHDYYAFGPSAPGGTSEKSQAALRYTGHERDAWNGESFDTLDYMHARYYSSSLGRFMSIDRHLGRRERPQTWNRYTYALNDPLRLLDPDGNDPNDFKIIHVRVNVIYSNADRTAPPFVMHSLRDSTEAGIIQARQHYAEMGISLRVVRYEGTILLDDKGNIGGVVDTPGGPVSVRDFINAQAGRALTLMATPDVPLGGGASSGTKIVKGVPLWTVLQGGPKDAEHEMAHSFGNTIGGSQNDFTNAVTDFVWFAERTQHDLFPRTIGFSFWFEERLRAGAEKLDKNDQ